MDNNICHFIPYHKDYNSIHIINFVLETKPQYYTTLASQPMYKMHLVCKGKGNLHVAGDVYSLSEGDVFFTFPTTLFCIESVEDFSYMYISFLGARGNMIMDMLKISHRNFLFHGCNEICDFWQKGLNAGSKTAELIAESILLYSFYYLGNEVIPVKIEKEATDNVAMKIKKYIDDNYSMNKLSLENIGNELRYHPKYISSVFKKKFKVGIAEYINTIRIQKACSLISQGFTSVSDIAYQCGYNDTQYFSKVFKTKVGASPRNYIGSLEKV